MKILLAGIALFILSAEASGGELKWRTFDAGLAEAKQSNKKILLDVYTDWCGWCKKLDKDVYANDKVAAYLNKAYVIIKLNAESNGKLTYRDKSLTEGGLAQAFGVRGYPTIIFLDSNGEPINSLGGYVAADRFLPIIMYIGDDKYKSMTWDEYRQKSGLDKN